MKYIRKKINLENFTVRSIPKSVLIKDSEGKTVINTDSPNYYYGTIPEYKIDEEGNFILTPFGQKIKNTIDVDLYEDFKTWDLGDIAGVRGKLFRTRTEELTIEANDVVLITKSIRPMPDKFKGLSDIEIRYIPSFQFGV